MAASALVNTHARISEPHTAKYSSLTPSDTSASRWWMQIQGQEWTVGAAGPNAGAERCEVVGVSGEDVVAETYGGYHRMGIDDVGGFGLS